MTKDSTKGELRRDKIGQPTPAKDELRDDELDTVTGGANVCRFGLRANGVEILQFAVGGSSG